MENKQVLYSMEQGGDIRYYKAAEEYSIDDLLSAANNSNPFLKLMDMGEQISIGEYAEIQQSDRFSFSVEMNFDTLSGTIYEVNYGKGGIAEEDRTDDNIIFTSGKLSELREKIADLAQRRERETAMISMMTSAQDTFARDKTFAYEFGHSFPFTVVHLDISTEERKNAVSAALNNVIHNIYGERDDRSRPYKNLLENIQPERNYISAFEGHLLCLQFALKQSKFDKNRILCTEMFYSVKHAEATSRCGRIEIKGENCRQTDAWEDHGVICVIGQSIHDHDCYYVRATDERITRDFEFDHKPSHEEVISKYTDLLSEEYMDRYEAEHGADGYGAFSAPESQERVENIRQMQDISHQEGLKTNQNQEERKMNITAKVTPLDREDSLKGLASVTINGSFVISSIRIYAGEDGLFAKMPQTKDFNGQYRDLVFPITKEAREQLNNTVIEQYAVAAKIAGMTDKEKEAYVSEYELAAEMKKPLNEQDTALYKALRPDGEQEEKPEKIALSVSLRQANGEHVRATGQITINDSFVVSNVKVVDGGKGLFVSMPSYQDQYGDYHDIAFPVKKDVRMQLDNAVLGKYNDFFAERRGVAISDLGEKGEISYNNGLNRKFAEKVMAELDARGIKYAAKTLDTTSIAVAKKDVEAYREAVSAVKPKKEETESDPTVSEPSAKQEAPKRKGR